MRLASVVFCMLLVASCSDAWAGSCSRRVVAVNRAVAVDVVPVLTLPSYSVGYVGDGVEQIAEELRQLRAELQQWRATMAGPGGRVTKEEAPPVPKGFAVMAQRCAVCHDEAVAKAKAKGNAFFRGGAFIDQGENANRVLEQIHDGKMPKGGKLTDAEKYDILWALTVREKAEEPKAAPAPPEKLRAPSPGR